MISIEKTLSREAEKRNNNKHEAARFVPLSDEEREIERLAGLPALEYDRERDVAAKALGCRNSTLDGLVYATRAKDKIDLQGRALNLREMQPWPEPVGGAEVLSDTSEQISRYVVLPDGAADVIAVWSAHTYVHNAFEHTPRLNITSPDKRCGKTTARDVLAELVARPLPTENLSTAVLFRVIEHSQPTFLADEVDTWLADNDELRGLLNAGHKRNGQALRCEGEGNEVRGFTVFAPAVLCGIGSLPGTLADRAIPIQMARAKRGEVKERFDSRHTDHLKELARKLARFCADSRAALEHCDPVLPEGAYNRVADNWRPLFAIAEAAGGDWPERIANAFSRLVSSKDLDDQGLGTMLLADIRAVLNAEGKVFSRVLIARLNSMADRPWPEAGKGGKPITERWLASRLRGFKIYPGDVHIGNEHAKGYELTAFAESFARYLDDASEPSSGDSNRASVQPLINIGENERSIRVNGNRAHGLKHDERPINTDFARLHGSIDSKGAQEVFEL
jgi:putative DNA primase/helicase